MSVSNPPMPDAIAAGDVRAEAVPSAWREKLRTLLRQRIAVVGLLILGFLGFAAVFADQIAPYDPNQVLLSTERGIKRLSGPCIHALGCPADRPEHFMGVDGNGRDEFSRIVHGSRISLQVGVVTVGFAIIIGALIGAVAGFAGGWTDNILMRIMDVFLVFPALLLAIAIVTVLGKSLVNAQLAVGIVAIPIFARVMRASVLTNREADYVTAARALGETSIGLLFRRIVPNSLTALIVAGTLGIGAAVLEVAALSFLGIGAQPPLAEWGSMVGLDRGQLFIAPHLIFFPGMALALTVLGFNLLGDGLRDALDPRLNR